MHVTQPTASAQLKEVTAAVGLPLHEVISRRVHLTDAGQQLAQTARAMLAEWEAFEQQIDQVKGLTRGRLQGGGGRARPSISCRGSSAASARQHPGNRRLASRC